MKTVIILALFFCCAGCNRHEAHPGPYAHVGPPPMPRHHAPKLTVITNHPGPISYRWAYTNGPDGTKVLQFRPDQ